MGKGFGMAVTGAWFVTFARHSATLREQLFHEGKIRASLAEDLARLKVDGESVAGTVKRLESEDHAMSLELEGALQSSLQIRSCLPKFFDGKLDDQ